MASVLVSLLHSLQFLVQSRASLHLEILALRHQLTVVTRSRVLAGYVAHYMRSRTHLALAKDSPVPRPVQLSSVGCVVATPEVGGLHHRYDRVAA